MIFGRQIRSCCCCCLKTARVKKSSEHRDENPVDPLGRKKKSSVPSTPAIISPELSDKNFADHLGRNHGRPPDLGRKKFSSVLPVTIFVGQLGRKVPPRQNRSSEPSSYPQDLGRKKLFSSVPWADSDEHTFRRPVQTQAPSSISTSGSSTSDSAATGAAAACWACAGPKSCSACTKSAMAAQNAAGYSWAARARLTPITSPEPRALTIQLGLLQALLQLLQVRLLDCSPGALPLLFPPLRRQLLRQCPLSLPAGFPLQPARKARRSPNHGVRGDHTRASPQLGLLRPPPELLQVDFLDCSPRALPLLFAPLVQPLLLCPLSLPTGFFLHPACKASCSPNHGLAGDTLRSSEQLSLEPAAHEASRGKVEARAYLQTLNIWIENAQTLHRA